MAIQTQLSDDGQTLTIRIDGRFDFSTHQSFRDAYEKGDQDVREYVIDMSGTRYLDSSALGMLLLLRDYAGGEDSRVRIRNCNSDVKRILTISNFEQLFTIE
ncbi:anti-anti-sigma factor [Tamilnaduibacter salinus]|uniref:Anti-anti-sigma factor n=1 Tax=Tamilnaduibacter salinus TaxID=1484056 RepID=A0A2A2I7S8_9GAMM|nr:STAS domain-containing protein [Tamilnaduibacter salinus]PAV27376.1 anti-anti-sigma factor [Tamilnaduibacter salinus]PVY79251.1 anti-anti-sigma factor [Tamilnaduibacter salinus]